MLTLQEKQTCPYSIKCPYNVNNTCQGSNPLRQTVFNCGYVINGTITNNQEERNILDQTGRMKVIME